jgi:hypothetical protein
MEVASRVILIITVAGIFYFNASLLYAIYNFIQAAHPVIPLTVSAYIVSLIMSLMAGVVLIVAALPIPPTIEGRILGVFAAVFVSPMIILVFIGVLRTLGIPLP